MFSKCFVYHLFFVGFCLISSTVFAQQNSGTFTGSIIYIDPQLEKLIPKDTKIEVIGSGFQHIESPVWIPDSNMVLFSDTKARVIYRWSAEKGLSKFLKNAGFTGRLPYSEEPGSNGLALTKDKVLLICEHGDRRIAAFPMNGKYGLYTVADDYMGKRFNSPNDVITKSDGNIYFTDPPYGLPQKGNDPIKEASVNGVYYISKAGKVNLLISDLAYPNGLAFSPDEKLLYVSVSDQQHPQIMSYIVNSDGTVKNGKIFFDASPLPREQQKQVTDGLKVDPFGNVWSSGPGGLLIINKKGKLLGKISTGEVISNCCFGNNGAELYITAGSYLYRINMNK